MRDAGLERYLMRMNGMGEGYVPAIKLPQDNSGAYGADWRAVPGLSGVIPQSMPMTRPMAGLGYGDDIWEEAWQYAVGKITRQDFDTVKGLFDGTTAAGLKELKAEMKRRQAELADYKSQITDQEMQDAYDAAYAKLLDFETNVLDAISWYNNGVWQIREVKAYADILSIGGSAPEYLSGMGALGILPVVAIALAVAVVALAGSAAFIAWCTTSRDKAIIAKADNETLKQYIAVLPKVTPKPITENVSDIAMYLAIGAAVYFGYKMVSESGGLKGVADVFKSPKARTA